MKSPPKPPSIDRQSKLLFIVMVIIGYIVTFFFISGEDGRRITPAELCGGFAFGDIYLLLGLNERIIFERLPAGWAAAIFFSVQCVMIFGIGLVLGTGGNWLNGISLVGFTVEMLAPRQRWSVDFALLTALILPI